MSIEGQVRTTIDEMLKVVAIRNVIGEPIESEDKVIIPVTKLGVGFGTGAGLGKGNGSEGSGGGAGGGAGVTPVAVIVVLKGMKGAEGVKVLPLTTPSPLTKALGEVASSVIEGMRGRREGRGKEVEVRGEEKRPEMEGGTKELPKTRS